MGTEKIKNAILQWISDNLNDSAEMFRTLVNGSDLGSLVSVACQNLSALQGIGMALFTLFFLMRFCESTLKDKNDPDSLFKELAWAIIFGSVILQLDNIIPALSSIAGDIINHIPTISVSGSAVDNDALVQQYKDELQDKFLLTLILDAGLFLVFGNIGMLIVEIIASIAVWTVRIEIVIRTIFAPIGVALLADSGWQGAGGRYIRAWVACYLQIGIMQAAVSAYSFVMATAPVQAGSVLGAILAGGLACAGICMKSSALAKEITGA